MGIKNIYMKIISQAAVIALMLATTQGHRLEQKSTRVTDETAQTINDAVRDVVGIT